MDCANLAPAGQNPKQSTRTTPNADSETCDSKGLHAAERAANPASSDGQHEGSSGANRNVPLHDMHCHLDFARNIQAIAANAKAHGSLIFANTVTPLGFQEARRRLFAQPNNRTSNADATSPTIANSNVKVGLGLHPWYIDNKGTLQQQLDAFDQEISSTRFVGEVGLDFSKRKADTAEKQLAAFRHIVAACAQTGGKLLSIHAIKSADAVLDVLEDAGTLDSCDCIFHWFSGSSDQLWRAVRAGCYFSVGPFMANSRRGREYIKQIPRERLLLETDYPPTGDGATYDPITNEPRVNLSFGQIENALADAARAAKERKGDEILFEIDETSRRLLAR